MNFTDVVIVDNDAFLSQSLALTLSRQSNLSAEIFDTFEAAATFFTRGSCKVLVTAYLLKDGSYKDLLTVTGQLPYIVLKSLYDYIIPGSSDLTEDMILYKPYDTSEARRRIHGLLDVNSQDLSDLFSLQKNLLIHRRYQKSASLTSTEATIMKELLLAEGQAVSRDYLSVKIDRQLLEYGDRKYDVHISRLRKKIKEIAGDSAEINNIRSIGYRLTAS